jgi:hypothetical protein
MQGSSMTKQQWRTSPSYHCFGWFVFDERTNEEKDAKDGAWDTVGERQDFGATAKMTLAKSVRVCVSVISSVRRQ